MHRCSDAMRAKACISELKIGAKITKAAALLRGEAEREAESFPEDAIRKKAMREAEAAADERREAHPSDRRFEKSALPKTTRKSFRVCLSKSA